MVADRPARGPRCAVCTDPMPPDLAELERWRTHPCCDPDGARWVHYWAQQLRREQVRARADEARRALRAAESRRSRAGGRTLAAS